MVILTAAAVKVRTQKVLGTAAVLAGFS